DKNLSWCDDATLFFKKMKIPVIYFDDDYFEVISTIKETVPEPAVQPDDNKTPDNTSAVSSGPEKIRLIEKEKIVEKKIYAGIEKKIVIVSNLTKCAGSTTITINLAKYISNQNIIPTVIEPPIESPTLFHWMAIEEKLNSSNGSAVDSFCSYPHEIWEGKTIRPKSEFIFEGIAWIVADDRKEIIDSWDYNQMIKLIYASSLSPITLVDIGSNLDHDSVKPILSSAHVILVVTDPFPSSCIRQNQKLEEIIKLRQEGFPIHFVVNKWNSGVEEKEFLNYLGCEPAAFISAINPEFLYRANYRSIIPYEFPEVSALLNGPLKKICLLFLPGKFIRSASSGEKNRWSIVPGLKRFSSKLVSTRESLF
ncbi:MAG: hypothetical protein JW770_02085, partial [Actinobacteria bacterium]|nr:hypothetical protein [Actinomycetota bacterium]